MVADDYGLLHSFFIINAGDADMNEEKIVYPFKIKLLLFKSAALLFFKGQGAAIYALGKSVVHNNPNIKISNVLTSSRLVQKPNIFLLPLIVLISNKALSKNNFEVNLS